MYINVSYPTNCLIFEQNRTLQARKSNRTEYLTVLIDNRTRDIKTVSNL